MYLNNNIIDDSTSIVSEFEVLDNNMEPGETVKYKDHSMKVTSDLDSDQPLVLSKCRFFSWPLASCMGSFIRDQQCWSHSKS